MKRFKGVILRVACFACALIVHGWAYSKYQVIEQDDAISASQGSQTLSVSFSFVANEQSRMTEKARPTEKLMPAKKEMEQAAVQHEKASALNKEVLKSVEPDSLPGLDVVKTSNVKEPNRLEAQQPLKIAKKVVKSDSTEKMIRHEEPPEEVLHQSSEDEDAVIDPQAENVSLAKSAIQHEKGEGVHDEIVSDPRFKAPPQPPNYPRLARKRGQEGVVWLDVWLDRNGKQTRLEVFDSSGVDSLDHAAVKAVSQWDFLPRRSGSYTIASRVRIPVEFSLN
ncbi:energy transducer TonB [Litoribacillus peritrichatus]|uniref:Energy transducer TonB n=1 Tax=Litoribacillus peritrichatus TaxID=718191 RepID=A0ABP7MED5_9GAMM